jgi:hypothetical protein
MKPQHINAQHPSYDGIQIVRLGRAEWRINDAADADRLLGFIERQQSGRFEVMWMTDPMRWGYTSSFDDAVVAFSDSVRFAGDIFEQRAEFTGRASGAGHSRRTTWIRASRLRGSRHPNVA